MTTGICADWATADDVCGSCADPAVVDPDILDRMLPIASELLNQYVGGLFPGACETVLRPCSQYSDTGSDYLSTWRNPNWGTSTLTYNARMWDGYCSCNRSPVSRQCGCYRLSEIRLSHTFPIRSISEILVDGVILDPSRYRVDDGFWLVALPDQHGNLGSWPCCQRLDLPSTSPDTFQVTATFGMAPPASGVLAAAALACDLSLLCAGNTSACRLPSRATVVTRQGVTINMARMMDLLRSGVTGIAEVDLFLAAYRPKGGSWGGALIPGSRSLARRTGTA